MKSKKLKAFLISSLIIQTAIFITNFFLFINFNFTSYPAKEIVVISCNMVAIVMGAILTIVSLVAKANNTLNTYLFGLLTLINTLTLESAILSFITNGTAATLLLNKIASLLFYNFGIIMLILFWHFLSLNFSLKNKYYKIITILVDVLGIVFIIIACFNYFYGFYYYYDENKIYHRGDSYIVSVIYSVLIYVLDIVVIIINKKYSIRDKIPYIVYITIPIIGVIIQIFSGYAFTYVGVMFSLTTLFAVTYIKGSIELYKTSLELEDQKIKIMFSQIQPHFLYNSLSAIMGIDDCGKNTFNAIADFSDYLRNNINLLVKERMIPLNHEIEHAKAYLRLQELRTPGKYEVIFDIEDDTFSIPPISLQVLLENALKYAFKGKDKGTVTIRCYSDDENHYIIVSDDGNGFDGEVAFDDTHTGLKFLQSRLTAMCGGKLKVVSKLNVGTKATIAIPKEDKINEDNISR